MKRTRLQRKKPLVARAKPRRRGRAGKPPTVAEVAAREAFKVTVCSSPCIGAALPGHVCDGPLQAMHVVPKQTLKRRGLAHLVWCPKNGVAGCVRIHTRHDGCVTQRDGTLAKIPRELLPQRCLDFAAEHGVTDALERHWPEGIATKEADDARHLDRSSGAAFWAAAPADPVHDASSEIAAA